MKEIVQTTDAPGAVGPYSQAVIQDGWVYVSGQIPLDPATGELVEGGVEQETEQVLANLKAVLEAAGSSVANVVKATVYLVDMSDFAAVNAIYAKVFSDRPPARVCVEVSRLPKGAQVEVDAIAKVAG